MLFVKGKQFTQVVFMASKYLSAGTANYVAATRTISGATMTPVFEAADATEQRQVILRDGNDIYYGRISSFVSASSVVLLNVGELPDEDVTLDDIILLDLSEQHSYQDYIDELKSLIKDDVPKLTDADLDLILAKAVADHSKHKPFYVRKKIQGNGTSEYDLQAVLGSLWKHGYSAIREIEYPIGNKPRTVINDRNYEIYDDGTAQDGSNLILRFLDESPPATDFFIVAFNTELDLPEAGVQNFPDTDETFSNITTLAAAYACQRLAAAYAPSSDSTISSDTVNYHEKSGKYSSLSRQYMRQYNWSVFGSEEPIGAVGPAIIAEPVEATTNEDEPYLFHRRRR